MKNLFFSQGGASGASVRKAIENKKPLSMAEELHTRFVEILKNGRSYGEEAARIRPKTKTLIREVGIYTTEDVTEFCNGLGRYMKKEDGKILVNEQGRALVRDEYKDYFAKCITEFLGTLINRYTGAKYKLPIAGWGVYKSLTIRDGVEATVVKANMGETKRI